MLELWSCRRRRFRGGHGAFDDTASDLGGEQTVAGGQGRDRVDELLGLGGFEQKPARAGIECTEQEVVAVEGREHEDRSGSTAADDRLCRLESVHNRHLHIHADDIGGQLKGLVDGDLPILGLTDDRDAVLRFEDRAEAGTDHGLVVDEEDSGHRDAFAELSGRLWASGAAVPEVAESSGQTVLRG